MTRRSLNQVGLGSIFVYVLIAVGMVAILTFIGSRLMLTHAGSSFFRGANLPTPAATAVKQMACSGSEQSRPLFVDVVDWPAELPSPTRLTLRQRLVRLDLTAFHGSSYELAKPNTTAPQILLNLFPDTCITAVRDRVSLNPTGQGFVWVGHVNQNGPGSVLLSVENAVLYGVVRDGENVYEVRLLHDGIYLMHQRDPKARTPID